MRKGKKHKFRPIDYGKTVMGVVDWVDPKGRYIIVAYRVKTPLGKSPILRECLRRLPDGRIMEN